MRRRDLFECCVHDQARHQREKSRSIVSCLRLGWNARTHMPMRGWKKNWLGRCNVTSPRLLHYQLWPNTHAKKWSDKPPVASVRKSWRSYGTSGMEEKWGQLLLSSPDRAILSWYHSHQAWKWIIIHHPLHSGKENAAAAAAAAVEVPWINYLYYAYRPDNFDEIC